MSLQPHCRNSTQVSTPFITEKKCLIIFQHFECPSLFLMTDSILLSMEDISVAQISGEILCQSFETFFQQFLLKRLCCATFLWNYPKGILSNSSPVMYLARMYFTFFLYRNSCVILVEGFGSLSCWYAPPLPCLCSLGISSASIFVYPQTFLMSFVNGTYPTPFALMKPHIITPPCLCFTVWTVHSLW